MSGPIDKGSPRKSEDTEEMRVMPVLCADADAGAPRSGCFGRSRGESCPPFSLVEGSRHHLLFLDTELGMDMASLSCPTLVWI